MEIINFGYPSDIQDGVLYECVLHTVAEDGRISVIMLKHVGRWRTPVRHKPRMKKALLKIWWKILAADGFRCQYCGRTPRDEVRLVIDHVLPVCAGGKTELKNLITACELCNQKKRGKVLPQELVFHFWDYCKNRAIEGVKDRELPKKWERLFQEYHRDRKKILRAV